MQNGKIVVLHVITRLIGGGADENTIDTATGLSSQNSQYQCFLAAGFDSDMSILSRLNGRLPFILLPHLRRNISPIHDCLALFSLIRICRKTRCDIIHTHTAKAGILGRLAGKIAGVPLIIHTLHGSTFHPFASPPARILYRFLEKLTARFTDRILSVSSFLTGNYLSQGVGRPEQYCTVYSGISLEKYFSKRQPDQKLLDTLGILPNQKVVGTICQLEPRKGVSFFLNMAKSVKKHNPAIKFVIVGDGYQRNALETLSAELGIKGDVIFTGYRDDVAELLSIFDVFVLTSLWEGLPRVLVQAAAIGKPLVAFNVDGIPEIITSGSNGFLIHPKNTRELIQKVIYLLDNPSIAQAMGKRGSGIVGEKWRIKTMVSQTKDIYQNLLSQKNGDYSKHYFGKYAKQSRSDNTTRNIS